VSVPPKAHNTLCAAYTAGHAARHAADCKNVRARMINRSRKKRLEETSLLFHSRSGIE